VASAAWRGPAFHRLDKETSGCMVVAKNEAQHLALSTQIAGRSVEKVLSRDFFGGVYRA